MTTWCFADRLSAAVTHSPFSVKVLVPHSHSCYLNWNFLHRAPAEWNLFFILFLQFVEIILTSVPALCNTCSPIPLLRKPFSWNSSNIKGTQNSLRTDRFSPSLITSYSGSKLYWTEGDNRWTRVRSVQCVPFLRDLCPSPSQRMLRRHAQFKCVSNCVSDWNRQHTLTSFPIHAASDPRTIEKLSLVFPVK